MRPLTRDDYLLIAIVVASIFAGLCAFLVATYKVLEEIRERSATRSGQGAASKVAPGNLPERAARSPYRVSVIRH